MEEKIYEKGMFWARNEKDGETGDDMMKVSWYDWGSDESGRERDEDTVDEKSQEVVERSWWLISR